MKRANNLRNIQVLKFVDTIASELELTEKKCILPDDHSINYLKEYKVINLPLMNAERATLKNGKKVTLYVNEEVYLATKWTMKEINFEFIQLKRFTSFIESVKDIEDFQPIWMSM